MRLLSALVLTRVYIYTFLLTCIHTRLYTYSYTHTEKRAAANKEYLVEVTEEAIVGQVTVFNSKRDSIDDDKGDEDRKDKNM